MWGGVRSIKGRWLEDWIEMEMRKHKPTRRLLMKSQPKPAVNVGAAGLGNMLGG